MAHPMRRGVHDYVVYGEAGDSVSVGCGDGKSLSCSVASVLVKNEGAAIPAGWPKALWLQCWREEWLDFSAAAWCNLSIAQQCGYARSYQQWYARVRGLGVERKTRIGKAEFVMVLIPPGQFWMGSPAAEIEAMIAHAKQYGWSASWFKREGPRHQVLISQGFWLGKYPVTQGQWEAVMGENPSRFKGAGSQAPVESVSWADVQGFCQKVGGALGLPSEAQWEYACRAGTQGMSYAGDFEIKGRSNAPQLDKIAWYGGNSGVDYSGGYDSSGWSQKQYAHERAGTHPVGKKKPNAWGLHDMLGNVWEWCRDRFSADYYAQSPQEDPCNTSTGSSRVIRGGGWYNNAAYCRCAQRNGEAPGNRDNDVGWRPSGLL